MAKPLKGIELDDDVAEVTGNDADSLAALTRGALDEVSQLTIGGKISVIPEAFGRLTGLEHLHLEKCKVKALPRALFKLTSLQTLSAPAVKLERMPAGGWASLEHLSEVVLPSGLAELPEDFGDAANVAGTLDFRGTKLKVLPDSVGRMAKVTWLLCPTGLHSLPKSIGGMSSLESLTLGKVRALPDDLGKLKKLHTVWIYEGAPLKHLPESIGSCAALRSLTLRGAKLTSLPESLADCPLADLSLTRMDAITALPGRLGANGALKTLTLGTGITSLPPALLASKDLRRVVLPRGFEAALRQSSARVLQALGERVTFE